MRWAETNDKSGTLVGSVELPGQMKVNVGPPIAGPDDRVATMTGHFPPSPSGRTYHCRTHRYRNICHPGLDRRYKSTQGCFAIDAIAMSHMFRSDVRNLATNSRSLRNNDIVVEIINI